MLGIPEIGLWDGAQKMLRSVFDNRRTAVQGANSVSKDWTAGIAVIAWLFKYPYASKVICTAPTNDQVKKVMFGEIEKQFANLREHSPWPVSEDCMKSQMLDLGPEWYAFGRTTKEAHGMIGKFQGFKSPHLLVVVSEAQAVDDGIYDQIYGLMSSGNAHILEIGNPMAPFGRFWEHCTQPRFGYNVIKLSALDSPNVKAGMEIIPGMVTQQFIDDIVNDWGTDHPYYYARVLAEFPQNAKDCIIPMDWIMRQVRDEEFLRTPDPLDELKCGGLDVSKGGADETVHLILTGKKVSRLDCFHKVEINETTGWAKNIIKEERLDALAVDEGGLAGIVSFLAEDPDIRTSLIKILFGQKVEDSQDFANLAAGMWWNLRCLFEKGEIFIPNDRILIGQLAARRYEFTSIGKKKIKMQSKRESGEESPDRADALAMAAWARRYCIGIGTPTPLFLRETAVAERTLNYTGENRMTDSRKGVFEMESGRDTP